MSILMRLITTDKVQFQEDGLRGDQYNKQGYYKTNIKKPSLNKHCYHDRLKVHFVVNSDICENGGGNVTLQEMLMMMAYQRRSYKGNQEEIIPMYDVINRCMIDDQVDTLS